MRDLELCRCCGFRGKEVHHITPLCYGGLDVEENCCCLCYGCHINAPDTKEEFEEYCQQGGYKIPYLLGQILLFCEKKDLIFSQQLPIIKQMIHTLRGLDINASYEKYGKEVLLQ